MAADKEPLRVALVSLHYGYPAIVFVYYLISSTISFCTLEIATEKQPHPQRRLILSLMLSNVLTYLAQAVSIVAFSVISGMWLGQEDMVISLLSCILVFGVQPGPNQLNQPLGVGSLKLQRLENSSLETMTSFAAEWFGSYKVAYVSSLLGRLMAISPADVLSRMSSSPSISTYTTYPDGRHGLDNNNGLSYDDSDPQGRIWLDRPPDDWRNLTRIRFVVSRYRYAYGFDDASPVYAAFVVLFFYVAIVSVFLITRLVRRPQLSFPWLTMGELLV